MNEAREQRLRPISGSLSIIFVRHKIQWIKTGNLVIWRWYDRLRTLKNIFSPIWSLKCRFEIQLAVSLSREKCNFALGTLTH